MKQRVAGVAQEVLSIMNSTLSASILSRVTCRPVHMSWSELCAELCGPVRHFSVEMVPGLDLHIEDRSPRAEPAIKKTVVLTLRVVRDT